MGGSILPFALGTGGFLYTFLLGFGGGTGWRRSVFLRLGGISLGGSSMGDDFPLGVGLLEKKLFCLLKDGLRCCISVLTTDGGFGVYMEWEAFELDVAASVAVMAERGAEAVRLMACWGCFLIFFFFLRSSSDSLSLSSSLNEELLSPVLNN